MPDQELTAAEFGRAFKAFMDAMLAAAVPRRSPLQERIAAHLGADAAQQLRATRTGSATRWPIRLPSRRRRKG
jgi:hypothetical protein